MQPKILIVEDDHAIAEMLSYHLNDLNYQVETINDGRQGYEQACKVSYHLLLLDIMLPNMNGLEICQKLRQSQPLLPIILMTSLDSETDRVVGLELGADDYIVKPFNVRECQARIKSLLRRANLQPNEQSLEQDTTLHLGELTISPNQRTVKVKGQMLELTAKEFELLLLLAKQPGSVYTRNQLLEQVWGQSYSGYEHTVNTHINRLRNKFKQVKADTDYIQTVWGVGYKFFPH